MVLLETGQEAGCLRNLQDPDQFGSGGYWPSAAPRSSAAFTTSFYDHLFRNLFALLLFYRPSENEDTERVTKRASDHSALSPKALIERNSVCARMLRAERRLKAQTVQTEEILQGKPRILVAPLGLLWENNWQINSS